MNGCDPSVVTSKNKLKVLESAPSADEERTRFKRKLLELSRKRVKISLEYAVSFTVRAESVLDAHVLSIT